MVKKIYLSSYTKISNKKQIKILHKYTFFENLCKIFYTKHLTFSKNSVII